MELDPNLVDNNTSVDGNSVKSDEAINKTQAGQRHMDRKHKHSKAHCRSKEFDSDRRLSSASKRTLAQMTQSMSISRSGGFEVTFLLLKF